MRAFFLTSMASVLLGGSVSAAELSAVVQKATADLYSQPSFDAAKLATLARNTAVKISAQQGLWYQVQLPAGAPGFVRVDDVRIDYAGAEDGEASLHVLMGGKAGEGRVTETAGVRGIDESDLQSAAFDQAQLDAMVGNRVNDAAATVYAREQGWSATTVAYAGEARPDKSDVASAVKSAGGMLSALGGQVGSLFGMAAKTAPKSAEELAAEELALGPAIAGRLLGARPLWKNPDAQLRVNRVGRWLASQTSRPDLPWTFGLIDTPEVNAFAAPGGFILVTRGMYELLASDNELAAVLGHEISHCVQRDHYNVIRKQELASTGKDLALSQVSAGNETVAGSYARRYLEQYGATVMLTALDREAEYRADEAAEYYLARAGMNPLALYAVLQKMTALGSKSAMLTQLVRTHPPLDARMDRIDRRGYGALESYTKRG
jgi:Zn-dependent protease with chaperone function